jgi:superfamily II DNA or RNA helicase
VARGGHDLGAALINIPTGGGKTALIALLAHEGYGVRRALVLAPRVGIRDQLYLELSGKRKLGFFNKQGVIPSFLKRPVFTLSSTLDISVAAPGDAVFISTIQLLDHCRQNAEQLFRTFIAAIDIVLVDEGHYEPARSWSETIRGFGKPTVLFTATPYRNDLRAFKIDPRAIHVTRFADALAQRFIREVKVEPVVPENSIRADSGSGLL